MKKTKAIHERLALRAVAFLIILSVFMNVSSKSYADNVDPPLPLWKTEGEAPFPGCDARSFIVQNLDGYERGQLTYLDLSASATEVSLIPFGPPLVGFGYNGMGYNPKDNYLYAMKRGNRSIDSSDLLRIGADGQPRFVGELPAFRGSAIAADFDADGYFYVQNVSGEIFKYDLSGDAPVPVGTAPYTTGLNVADWGFHNGAMWGVHARVHLQDGITVWVAKVELNSVTGLPDGLAQLGPPIQWPTMDFEITSIFPAKNGLYAYDTVGGGLYRIDTPTDDPNDATIQYMADGISLEGSDGAKCANSPLGLPAEISVEKTTTAASFVPGDTVNFTVRVENQGPYGASPITLQDPLPAGATSATWTCTPSGEMAVCPAENGTGPIDVVLALQEAGSFVTFEITMQTDPAASAAIINTATITVSEDFVDDPSNNTDDALVPLEVVDFTVEKRGTLVTREDQSAPGDTIDYEVTVRNDSRVPLSNVTVSDPGPLFGDDRGTGTLSPFQPPDATLQPGEEATFTATYTITAEDLVNLAESGGTDIVNVATASVTTPADVSLNKDATSTVTVGAPAIHLTKSAELVNLVGEVGPDGVELADPGDRLEYTLVVTNTGSIPLDNIVLVDTFVSDLTRTNADLDANGYLQPGKTITYTATHTITQEDVERGEIYNLATVTSTIPNFPDRPGPKHTADNVEELLVRSRILVEKFGRLEPAGEDGAVLAGEDISYTVRLTNQGGVTLTDVQPLDEGPTFSGQPGTGTLSGFQPQSARLAPGESAEFTATYTLSEADIANGFGPNAVRNVATARGNRSDGRRDLEVNSAEAFLEFPDISIAKTADLSQVVRGGTVPFTIKLNAAGSHDRLNLVDTMPPGFTYVTNSARINDAPVEPQISGQRLVFPLQVQAGKSIVVRLYLAASAAVQPGVFLNYAHTELPGSGERYGPQVAAQIEVPVEPVFDCGELLGRVFEDKNRNGTMDEREEGVPGVRLVAVEGTTITTDADGRFHVTCADIPGNKIGSTFLLKLDTATLPTGFRILSENPRAVRLTPGKITRANFATSIARVVRVDINSEAFVVNTAELRPDWQPRLHQLIALLRAEPSILRLSYIDQSSNRRLAAHRVEFLRGTIRQLWEESASNYRLEIESRILTQMGQGWDDPNSISWVIEDE